MSLVGINMAGGSPPLNSSLPSQPRGQNIYDPKFTFTQQERQRDKRNYEGLAQPPPIALYGLFYGCFVAVTPG